MPSPSIPPIPTSVNAAAPAAQASAEVAALRPPTTGWMRQIKDVLDHGGPGYLQFAITNLCNAHCDFCGFALGKLDPTQRRRVTLAQALDVVAIARRNHIGYLLFVGGEPLTHPDLAAMVRACAEAGIRPMICSNGSLWTEARIRALARNGLASVIMSIDTHDIAAHERHRGLAGVCGQIAQANRLFRELNIPTTASITVSRLIADYEKLPALVEALGFRSLTFSYPLTALSSSYLSFSNSALVTFRTDELVKIFERIRRLKAASPLPVANPSASLQDMQRHLRGQPETFGCLGGHKYFYLDWNLDLYRCHYWEKPMCSIYEFDQTRLIRDGCTRCMIDCYRDPSVLQHAAVQLSEAWQACKQGQYRAAARHMLDRRNVLSLKAVWENRDWIGQY